MIPTRGLTACAIVGMALLTVGILGAVPADVAAQGPTLQPGDYAVYSLGDPPDECQATTPLYPPLFGTEDRTFAGACNGTIRWEILGLTENGAEVRLRMTGWPRHHIYFEDSFSDRPEEKERLLDLINATLNAEHVLLVDFATLDVTTQEGAYVGRWSFQVGSAELAAQHIELARNWYNGTSISANVTVVKDLPLGMSEVLKREYGVDTFAFAQTGWIEPVPEGIERYLYDVGGGWQQLWPSAPVYDASSSLLLVSLSRFYSDLLFNLYGVFWLDQLDRAWPDARPLTSLILVDTNVIALPGLPDGGGAGDPDVGGDTETGAPGEGPPWATMLLFAAIAVSVVLLAYQRLRPRGRGAANQPEPQPRPGDTARPFGREKG